MSIKIGHSSLDERKKASGGKAGDSTGGEVCLRSWYDGNWTTVLRPKNATLAEKSAKACEAGCANNKVGYDQGQRNTLYTQAKAKGFDLSKITTACECDCSSFMHVCAIAGGANLSYGSNGLVTWNMADAFVKSGDYEQLTASKYLTSDAYLKRGDILIKSGHVVMVLENGSKAGGGTSTNKKASTTTQSLKPVPAKLYDTMYGTSKGKTYTTTTGLNMRTKPGTKDDAGVDVPIIQTMPKGRKVVCYGYYGRKGSDVWLYVKDYTTGAAGYCSLKYLRS